MSWNENEGRIEASLGGRVTADEMLVFAGEVEEVVASFPNGFELLIDHSKAKEFDRESLNVLRQLKDRCLASGARTITTVTRDEDQLARETSDRLTFVLEGRERVVLEAPWSSEPAAEAGHDQIAFGLAA